MKLNRRDFLYLTGGALGLFMTNPLRKLEAAAPNLNNMTLIHLLMEGGPDFRHIIVPNPTSAYGQAYWKNRARALGVSPSSSGEWSSKYSKDFTIIPETTKHPEFGISKRCGWLVKKYQEGKVAIVCNVKHSESRDHQRSLLVLQKGSYSTAAFSSGGSGWGGRLIGSSNLDLNTNQKIISVTSQVRTFCNGNPANIVSFRNSRKFGLYTPSSNLIVNSWDQAPSKDPRVVMYRAQSTYYDRKTGLANTNFEPFYKHYLKLKALTQNIKAALQNVPLSSGLNKLSEDLKNKDFAQQIQSAHDAFVCRDLLGMRILSMNYGGFDTHKRQREELDGMLEEIFGEGKGLDELFKARSNDFQNSVIVAYGEFGRQLKANGDNSTDHGDANYVLMIGGKVNGGVYGDLFPSQEIPEYEYFHRGIKSRNNFRAAFQSLITAMGHTPTDVFNMTLTPGVDYENDPKWDFTNIVQP
jgi:uncharacterized protein (DUF1501 family)